MAQDAGVMLSGMIAEKYGEAGLPDKTVNVKFKGSAEQTHLKPQKISKTNHLYTERYDIKGRKYIASPFKYYFTDVGLRNVRLNFRQQEENHIMENIIYNELLVRDFNVDVGIVEYRTKNAEGKQEKVNLEVDFVCNKGSQRFYIQSAFSIPDREKMKQEQNSLVRINDSFKKIIVVKDDIKPWYNEEGILVLGLQQFLLQPESMLL